MEKFNWTDSKIRQLNTYYPVTPNKQLAELLKCSTGQIEYKAKELDLKKRIVSWSQEQDDYLIKHYATEDWEELQEELDKTKGQIVTRAKKFDLKRVRVSPYASIDKEYVSKHYNGYNLHPLAEKFNVTPEQMYAYIKRHKINRKVKITQEIREKRKEIAEQLNAGKTKICPRCGLVSEKPTLDYTVDYGTYDALNRMCTTCRTEYEDKVKASKLINQQIRKEEKWLKSIQKQEFQCKVCQGIFKGGEMSLEKSRMKVTSLCKTCRNKYQKEKQIERMYKKAKGEFINVRNRNNSKKSF